MEEKYENIHTPFILYFIFLARLFVCFFVISFLFLIYNQIIRSIIAYRIQMEIRKSGMNHRVSYLEITYYCNSERKFY